MIRSEKIGIGIKVDTEEDYFYGFIDFVNVYQQEILFKDLNNVLKEYENMVKDFNLKGFDGLENGRETFDDRKCLDVCVDEEVPGLMNSPVRGNNLDLNEGKDIIYFLFNCVIYLFN